METGIEKDRANTACGKPTTLPPKAEGEELARGLAHLASIRASLGKQPQLEDPPSCLACGAIEHDHVCPMEVRTHALERSGFK